MLADNSRTFGLIGQHTNGFGKIFTFQTLWAECNFPSMYVDRNNARSTFFKQVGGDLIFGYFFYSEHKVSLGEKQQALPVVLERCCWRSLSSLLKVPSKCSLIMLCVWFAFFTIWFLSISLPFRIKKCFFS